MESIGVNSKEHFFKTIRGPRDLLRASQFIMNLIVLFLMIKRDIFGNPAQARQLYNFTLQDINYDKQLYVLLINIRLKTLD